MEILVDPYYWLNERENPNVISYLEENNYSKSILKSTEKFQRKLFDEMKGELRRMIHLYHIF